jgi:hypothetical protein
MPGEVAMKVWAAAGGPWKPAHGARAGCQPCWPVLRSLTELTELPLSGRRYYLGPGNTARKLEVLVDVPDALDLEHLRGRGAQPGEALQPDAPAERAASAPASAAAPPAPLAPDAATVAALVGMGFSENGSKRAALATQARGRRVLLGLTPLRACMDGVWCQRGLLSDLRRGRECEPAGGHSWGTPSLLEATASCACPAKLQQNQLDGAPASVALP